MSAATTVDRSALPEALRRPAAGLSALSAVAVDAIGTRYAGMTTATRTDQVLYRAIDGLIPERERLFDLVQ